MFNKIKNLFIKLCSSIKNHKRKILNQSSEDDKQMLIDAFINAGLEYNETIGKELKISKEEYDSIKNNQAAKIEEMKQKWKAEEEKKKRKYKINEETYNKADERMNNFYKKNSVIIKDKVESAKYHSNDAAFTVMKTICDNLPKDFYVSLKNIKEEDDKMEFIVSYGIIENNMILSGDAYTARYIINVE